MWLSLKILGVPITSLIIWLFLHQGNGHTLWSKIGFDKFGMIFYIFKEIVIDWN